MPPLNTIMNIRTLHRLKVTQRQFFVKGEEEFIVGTFGGDGFGGRPGGGREVFGSDVAERADVESLEFRGHEGATAGVVEVEDEVFDGIGEEVVRHGWGWKMRRKWAVGGGGKGKARHKGIT